jgi:hypothetical protein
MARKKWQRNHGTLAQQLDEALEDPTLESVGVSLAAYRDLQKGIAEDDESGGMFLFVLPRILGVVYVFWYDRADQPLRLLGMDEEGAAWAWRHSQNPNDLDLTVGWEVEH